MAELKRQLAADVARIEPDLVAWRRHLHQNPELSFQEHETTAFIEATLRTFGALEITRPTPTGVVARLIGSRPGPVVAIRADIDALPIQEENSFAFRSQRPGVMHACGHDGHTTMLLGAAKVLTGYKRRLSGEVRFIFQHAEEQLPGGAESLVQAGVMDHVDRVIGAHMEPDLPVGTFAMRSGPVTASPDTFRIVITGLGGHAADPHRSVDPVAIAVQVVANLQMIVARNTDPQEALVVSVTKFMAGTADNIIPGSVELGGTVRSFNPELRQQVPVLMERIVRGVTEAHGASYEFTYVQGYRSVINDQTVTDLVRRALTQTFGPEAVVEGVPLMAGEDFSAYQTKAPGCFYQVGSGNVAAGITYPLHHPRFTLDEGALPVGVMAFLACISDWLKLADGDFAPA
ncbi:MAG: M20 metallopeptidase family protein [Sulfobacillus sp.]